MSRSADIADNIKGYPKLVTLILALAVFHHLLQAALHHVYGA
jgi:hypothetical protein